MLSLATTTTPPILKVSNKLRKYSMHLSTWSAMMSDQENATNPPQYSISKILMDFRNTIQLERDKLYKTRNTDVTGVAQAQLKASEAINQLIYTQVLELIGEIKEY